MRGVAQATTTFYILDMDGNDVTPKKMARIKRRLPELYAEGEREEAGAPGDMSPSLRDAEIHGTRSAKEAKNWKTEG